MSNILTSHVWGYEHFAPYFINDDPSGLTDDEIVEADQFLKEVKKEYGQTARIVSCGEEEDRDFGWPEYGGKKGTVIPYYVHYDKE